MGPLQAHNRKEKKLKIGQKFTELETNSISSCKLSSLCQSWTDIEVETHEHSLRHTDGHRPSLFK